MSGGLMPARKSALQHRQACDDSPTWSGQGGGLGISALVSAGQKRWSMKNAPGVSIFGSRAALTAAAVISANGAGCAWFFSRILSMAGTDHFGLSWCSRLASALAWLSVIKADSFLQSNVPVPAIT